MTKNEQRQMAKFKVATMDEFERKKADDKIRNEILSLSSMKNSKNVFCFLSASREPDTIKLIGELIKNGKKVGVPKCVCDTMQVVEIDENCDFVTGAYGIIEPTSDKLMENVDVVLTPLVAFDMQKNRLGHGKGYYDKFFENCSALKIGVAYACQEIESVAVEEFDKKLDMIVTENGVIK